MIKRGLLKWRVMAGSNEEAFSKWNFAKRREGVWKGKAESEWEGPVKWNDSQTNVIKPTCVLTEPHSDMVSTLAWPMDQTEERTKRENHIKLQQHVENLSSCLLLSHSLILLHSHPILSCPPLYLPSCPKTKTHSSSFLPTVLPFVCTWLVRDTMAHIWTGPMPERGGTPLLLKLIPQEMAIKAKHTLSSILAQAWKVIFFFLFLQNEMK